MTKAQTRALRLVRKTLEMETASFGLLHPDGGDPLPSSERDVTGFVRRRTALWRASWVFPILDTLINEADARSLNRFR